MLSKDFYKDCNLFGNITYFEWWKLKNPSLELFYNEIQKYECIISHSAGSTILMYTLLNYKVSKIKRIISFDGHILANNININYDDINVNKIMEHTYILSDVMKRKNRISNLIKKNFINKNNQKKIYLDWAKMILNINIYNKNVKFSNNINWVEIQFTKICKKGKMYLPYNINDKNNCDLFSKKIKKVTKPLLIIIPNANHFTLLNHTKDYIPLIKLIFNLKVKFN